MDAEVTWRLIRALHLLAMGFFVGGQIVLAAAVVPVGRRLGDRTALRAIARRFGYGTLVAFAVLIPTGAAMAGHYGVWGSSVLHVKLALVVVAFLLIVAHMRKPTWHALEGLVFVVSLAIVWLGVTLAH